MERIILLSIAVSPQIEPHSFKYASFCLCLETTFIALCTFSFVFCILLLFLVRSFSFFTLGCFDAVQCSYLCLFCGLEQWEITDFVCICKIG